MFLLGGRKSSFNIHSYLTYTNVYSIKKWVVNNPEERNFVYNTFPAASSNNSANYDLLRISKELNGTAPNCFTFSLQSHKQSIVTSLYFANSRSLRQSMKVSSRKFKTSSTNINF